MIIKSEEKGIYVSTIDIPFKKILRCVNAAEGDIVLGSPSAALMDKGYFAIISAGFNLPTSDSPDKIYGVQDLYITLEQAKSLGSLIQCFLGSSKYKDENISKTQNTAILPTQYEMISEMDGNVRVSGIGIELKEHLFCANKTPLDSKISLGDSVGYREGFKQQGYVATICAGIDDGNDRCLSTQDLYVTYRQILQLNSSIQLLLKRFGENPE